MEGFKEHQLPLPLIVTFADFKKAFDSIDSSVMFSVLRPYGIPETLAMVNAIQVLYTNSSCSVMVDASPNHLVFPQGASGDAFAPFLFIILVDYLLLRSSDGDSGVKTCPRKSRRYPAKVLRRLIIVFRFSSTLTFEGFKKQLLARSSVS